MKLTLSTDDKETKLKRTTKEGVLSAAKFD